MNGSAAQDIALTWPIGTIDHPITGPATCRKALATDHPESQYENFRTEVVGNEIFDIFISRSNDHLGWKWFQTRSYALQVTPQP